MPTRIRMSPQIRRRQIVETAAELLGEKGYKGVTLREVADRVGISQPGLLHYVGNKAGLLSTLVTDLYDVDGTPDVFLRSGRRGSDPGHPHLPAYFRFLVEHNAAQPQLVKLYTVLQTEAVDPSHPLHDYFVTRPSRVWESYSRFPWALPPGLDWAGDMPGLIRMSLEAMDGIQVRLLHLPLIDYVDEWSRFEAILFPLPQWRGLL